MAIQSDRSNCERCIHFHLCRDTAPHDQVAGRRLRVRRHAALYRAGDAVGNSLYSIRSGSFKLVLPQASGGQVNGFALAPQFLGLNALGAATHMFSAIALEDSEVCWITWDRHAIRGRRQPLQRTALYTMLTEEIRRAEQAALQLHHTQAGERLAELMLSLSRTNRDNGYSPVRLRLPMSRSDIASYIGVTAECVSRVLDHFRRTGLVELCRRELTLLDQPALQQLASGREAA